MAVRGKKVDIDLAELEKLCMMQATDEELAGFFGVTTRTIERRRQDPQIAAVMERGKAKGRLSVRRHQFRILEDGNATMGIWLGKQILGQSENRPNADAPEIRISIGPAVANYLTVRNVELLSEAGEA